MEVLLSKEVLLNLFVLSIVGFVGSLIRTNGMMTRAFLFTADLARWAADQRH